jgi:aspartyl-tRNA(Asn)/glutamyl-tRNA(Gln) amidotransferase subunit A
MRIGVPRAHFFDQLDAEVDAATRRALAVLVELGAVLQDVTVPLDDDRTVFRAEAFAVHRQWVEATPERYQPETLRRILTGANVAAADYRERHRQLERMRRASTALFAGIDLLATPAVPVPAPTFAELEAHPDTLRTRELLLMRNTRPFSIWGTPALSVPCGTTIAGLPVGLQLAGPIGADAEVLRAGAAFEAATDTAGIRT